MGGSGSDGRSPQVEEISSNTQSAKQGIDRAREVVAHIKALQDYKRAAQREAWEQQPASQQPSPARVAQMQQWLESGDPILIAEAEAFFNSLQQKYKVPESNEVQGLP